MKEKTFISVVVTVFNQADLISECAGSLLDQDYQNFEIIFVDNFSTDGTWQFLEKFKRENGETRKIKLIRAEGNAARGRNVGIKKCRGSICAFTDSDAKAGKNWLSEIARTFDEVDSPKLAGVGGVSLLPEKRSRKEEIFYKILGSPLVHGGSLNPSVQHKKDETGWVGHLPTCNLAIKKEIFEKEGLFDERFDSGEDLELSTRLGKKGYKFFCSPRIVVEHHQRKDIAGFFTQVFNWGKGKGKLLKKFRFFSSLFVIPLVVLMVPVLLLAVSALLPSAYLGVSFSFLLVFIAVYTLILLIESSKLSISLSAGLPKKFSAFFIFSFLILSVNLLSTFGLISGVTSTFGIVSGMTSRFEPN
jgi:GT2 family glycosyltransferase